MLNGLDLILKGSAAQRIVLIGGGARSAAWRQLLADATGALIQIPAEEEAGCLGAAVQAAYAYSHQIGAPESFTALTGRMVHFDGGKAAHPAAARSSSYATARATYTRHLHELYPEAIVAPDALPIAP